MTMKPNTPFTRLAEHHAAHIYKKGANKGDAPLDKRGKSHLRIIKHSDCYAVLFHKTEILTATEDGTVVLDCDGYYDRPTTHAAMNEALKLCYRGVSLSMACNRVFSHSQPILYNYKSGRSYTKYRYYDGIVLDAAGNIASEMARFERKQLDKKQVAEFTEGLKASGFKDCFKMLWAVSEGDKPRNLPSNVAQALTEEVYSNTWADIIGYHAWETKYERDPNPALSYPHNLKRTLVKHPAPKVWAAIMSAAKRKMFEVVRTDITCVE